MHSTISKFLLSMNAVELIRPMITLQHELVLPATPYVPTLFMSARGIYIYASRVSTLHGLARGHVFLYTLV